MGCRTKDSSGSPSSFLAALAPPGGRRAAMPAMRAFRLIEWGRPPERCEVPVPQPGHDEVLVKVAGVGLCHTDLHFFDAPPGRFEYPAPFTIGHEVSGWVAETGAAVSDLKHGDPVVSLARSWCGQCVNCSQGNDNYCLSCHTGLGFGADGGLAEYVLVARRSLVGIAGLDPIVAGQLACAGNTAYHAVKKVLPKLAPGTTAVVLGVGGVGSYAVQFLRALSSTRIVAVDAAPSRLSVARELGAECTVLADANVAEQLQEYSDGAGVWAVLDFVGTDETVSAALATAGPLGSVGIVGAGGGTAHVSWSSIARECELFIPQNGNLSDLREVVAMARSGAVKLYSELFAFDQLEDAYELLRRGELRGRAVVIMGQSVIPTHE
jgi:alcohol dehydrogenase, propanol-preferring